MVHSIDKIDNFQDLGPPLLRWRASMEGPCHGAMMAGRCTYSIKDTVVYFHFLLKLTLYSCLLYIFSSTNTDFIMNKEKRQSWDPQIDNVANLYPINDLDEANIAMNGKYGDCEKLGVGYTKTKAHPIGISPREQLTLCGIQNFADGSSVIWGTELADWHDHLLPAGERDTRARSHLFSIALVPTGENSFDAEYSLQLDFGGNLPHWMTSPIVIDSVKGMFGKAQPFFMEGEGGELDEIIQEEKKRDKFEDRKSILFTP